MRDVLNIAVFTIAVSVLYTAVAQVLPQLPNHPPANVELGSNIGPEALAEAGASICIVATSSLTGYWAATHPWPSAAI